MAVQAVARRAPERSVPAKVEPPVSPVPREQVEKAVHALLQWISKRQQQRAKSELVEEDSLLHVVVAFKKVPEARTNGFRIPLPHSLHPAGAGEVCLIVRDDERGQPGHQEAKARLAEAGAAAGVTKVIGVSKLRAKYGQHEAKRQLCASYDLFLADDRVICLLPKLLGKTFFKKRKHPVPVDLRAGGGGQQWARKIREACDSTFLYIGGGPCSVVRAGRSTQEEGEIVDNVMAVIAGVAVKAPKKWSNVHSLHLKTTDSVALPLFVAEPPRASKIVA